MGEKTGGNQEENYNLDLTALKYLEYIYDSESGRKLYQRSLAGSLFMVENDTILQYVTECLNMDFFESINALNSHSDRFWEKRDFDLSRLSKKLESVHSAEVFEGYIDESFYTVASKAAGNRSLAADNQNMAIMESVSIGTAFAAVSAIAGIYSTYEGCSQTCYLKDLNNTFRKILERLNSIDKNNTRVNDTLRKIEKDINEIDDNLYEMSILINRKDLKDAENRVNGFLVEISAIGCVDNAERLVMIKNFLLHGYEEMLIAAFQSALNVNSYINSKLSDAKKIPFSMPLSDMSFMMELSLLRFSFAPLIFRGDNLLKYRASIAKADLARVRLLKRSFARAYNKIRDTEYRDTAMTMISAWEITLMAHIKTVQDLDDVVIVEIENAGNYNLGSGSFGDVDNFYGHLLTGDEGTFLIDTSNVKYGESISGIFDTGISGAFIPGRYLRIVENGNNVTDTLGLGLIPVCWNFSGGVVAPPKDKVYIDPITGQFVLPRPVYWSRMESMDDITSPEISEGKPYTEFIGTCTSETFPMSKFGGGYCLYNYDYGDKNLINASPHSGSRYIYPFGKGGIKNMDEGTISFWFKLDGRKISDQLVSNSIISGKIEICNEISNLFRFDIRYFDEKIRISEASLMLNGNFIGSFKITKGNWLYILVIWDRGKKLGGGKSVRIFANKDEVLSTNSDLPDLSNFLMKIALNCETQACVNSGASFYTSIDNIKIWDNVVTEDPNIFYNNGNGREDALHSIYGPENGYKPSIVSVGYHYVQ